MLWWPGGRRRSPGHGQPRRADEQNLAWANGGVAARRAMRCRAGRLAWPVDREQATALFLLESRANRAAKPATE